MVLPKSKTSTFKGNSVRVMVSSFHKYSQVMTNIFYDWVKSGNTPDILNYADITPVF